MSLYKNKLSIRILTDFYNMGIYKWRELNINTNMYTGSHFKFSEFGQECSIFKYSGNTFSGNVHVHPKAKTRRCKVFGQNFSVKSKANLSE